MVNSPKPHNPIVEIVGHALRALGFIRKSGMPTGLEHFRHPDGRWATLQDHPELDLADIVKHLEARGIDIDAFVSVLRDMEDDQKSSG